jgi:hypothetical protein
MKKEGKMIYKIKVIPIFSFLLVLIIFVSCGKKKSEWKGTVEEENGVTVIKNPKEPMYKEDVFSLEEELSIGAAEGREEYMFQRVIDVEVDEDERVYILDSKGAHIKIFNKSGEYLRTIGGKGQGPGEMQRPTSLQITPKKEILVNDSSARKLHFFTLDGNFLRDVSQAKIAFFTGPKMDKNSNIVASCMVVDEEVSYELKKFDSQLEEISPLFSTVVLKFPKLNPFFPQSYWEFTREGNLVWGFPTKYELNVVNPEGELIKKIIKEYTPVKITQKEKDDWIEERFGGYENVSPETKLIWDEYHHPFIFLSIDDEGRIFLRTYEKVEAGEGYYYDVFDAEGKYIAKIPLKNRPLVLKRKKLYTIEEDEEGYQAVKRYKITWKY